MNDNWIRIEDKQPHLGEYVLICRVGEQFIPVTVAAFCEKDNKFWLLLNGRGNVVLENVTHWQRFPEPPPPSSVIEV